MTETQLRNITQAAAALIRAKLLVDIQFDPQSPPETFEAPHREACPTCGQPKPGNLVYTTEASLTQPDAVNFLRSECKGILATIISDLNAAGGKVATHPQLLPSSTAGAVFVIESGLALRAVAQYDAASDRYALRFSVLYSRLP
jgi:hypothetical protein